MIFWESRFVVKTKPKSFSEDLFKYHDGKHTFGSLDGKPLAMYICNSKKHSSALLKCSPIRRKQIYSEQYNTCQLNLAVDFEHIIFKTNKTTTAMVLSGLSVIRV